MAKGMTEEQFAEHVKRTDRVVAAVYVFANGAVAVADQFGQQFPELQGQWPDVRERLRDAAPPDASWHIATEFAGAEVAYLRGEIHRLQGLLTLERRALARLVHGQGIESDYICPHEFNGPVAADNEAELVAAWIETAAPRSQVDGWISPEFTAKAIRAHAYRMAKP